MHWHPFSIDDNPKTVYLRERPDGVDLSVDGLSVIEHIPCRESDDRALREFMVLLLEAIDDLLLGKCSRRRLYVAMNGLRPSLNPDLPLHRAIGLMYGDPLDWSKWRVLTEIGRMSNHMRAFAIGEQADGTAYFLHTLEPRLHHTTYETLVFGPSEIFCEKLRSAQDWIRATEAWIHYTRSMQIHRRIWKHFDIDTFASVYPALHDEVADWRERVLKGETDSKPVLKAPFPTVTDGFQVRFPTLGFTYSVGTPCVELDQILTRMQAKRWKVSSATFDYGLHLGRRINDANMSLLQRTAGGAYLFCEIIRPDLDEPQEALFILDHGEQKRKFRADFDAHQQSFIIRGKSSSDGRIEPC